MNGNLLVLSAICITLILSGCGGNSLQAKDEAVKKAWEMLDTSCRKRAGLVSPYLKIVGEHVQRETVILGDAGRAAEEVLRNEVQKTPPASREDSRRYRDAQDELSRALARLAVLEADYPYLGNDPWYVLMHTDLTACETRINSARSGYSLAIHDFNLAKQAFPNTLANLLLFHYGDKEGLNMENKVRLAGEGSHQRAAMVVP